MTNIFGVSESDDEWLSAGRHFEDWLESVDCLRYFDMLTELLSEVVFLDLIEMVADKGALDLNDQLETILENDRHGSEFSEIALRHWDSLRFGFQDMILKIKVGLKEIPASS